LERLEYTEISLLLFMYAVDVRHKKEEEERNSFRNQ
jgi:hypothetical protein